MLLCCDYFRTLMSFVLILIARGRCMQNLKRLFAFINLHLKYYLSGALLYPCLDFNSGFNHILGESMVNVFLQKLQKKWLMITCPIYDFFKIAADLKNLG